MQYPTEMDLFDAIDATWAPFAIHNHQGWLIREGCGGGQRVSAATILSKTNDANVSSAVAKMRALGQNSLFMVRGSDSQLDHELETSGYRIVDPVIVLAAPAHNIFTTAPANIYPISQLTSPNEAAKDIWARGGIGPARLNIMARVNCPKSILVADNMGVTFVAMHKGIAMIHAVEVAKAHRRKGVANALMYRAIQWAKEQGSQWVSVLTVRENIPAITLYENLGMKKAATYHYRLKT
jgi:GNAT superfamily N-acetyltransferase